MFTYLTIGTLAGVAAFSIAILMGFGVIAALATLSSTATVVTLGAMVHGAQTPTSFGD